MRAPSTTKFAVPGVTLKFTGDEDGRIRRDEPEASLVGRRLGDRARMQVARRVSPTSTMSGADGFDEISELQAASARLLTNSLTSVLKRLESSCTQFVDEHCSAFGSFTEDGEHLVEWTHCHAAYCDIVEDTLVQELSVLGCSEDALLEHAVRAEGDPTADEVLRRLIAKTDYVRFCAMMRRKAYEGPTLYEDDGEFVEVLEDEEDAAHGEEDKDDDEGLVEALLEQAVARLRDAEV